jgi:hypothetical protein
MRQVISQLEDLRKAQKAWRVRKGLRQIQQSSQDETALASLGSQRKTLEKPHKNN